jgi:peptide/nickel transport system ATP-binding protein
MRKVYPVESMGEGRSMDSILKVEQLKTSFFTMRGVVKAVDEISFEVKKEESFGIVGESGCGKSTTALSIMRLLDDTVRIEGRILFNEKDIVQLSKGQMRQLWGKGLYMIFQDPMTSLNPVMRIGDQIAEVLNKKENRGVKASEIIERGCQLLAQVDIPDSMRVLNQYPHQLSGGMKQRVMIAIGIASNPDLLLLDEPTTALDSTVQFRIVELLLNLKKKYRMSQILITHDFGVAAKLCDRIAVMYAGKIVEEGKYLTLLKEAAHPYTQGLFKCIIDRNQKRTYLETMKGYLPSLYHLPRGCYFEERCETSESICRDESPALIDIGDGHLVACHHFRIH